MIGLGGSITSGVPESKYSASFDGHEDFLYLGKSNDRISVGQSNVTLMCWVKPTNAANDQYIFSNKRQKDNPTQDPSNASSNLSLLIFSDSGTLRFRAIAYNGQEISETVDTVHVAVDSSITVANNQWYHIAVTVTDTTTSDNLKLYVNGTISNGNKASGTITMNPSDSLKTNHACHIGQFDNTGGRYFKGLVSELSLFDAVLTSSNILYAYNNPGINLTLNQGDYDKSSSLTSYYKMGDGFFDDKEEGVIYDQVDTSFVGKEVNLITNANFDNGGEAEVTGLNSRSSTIPNWTISSSAESSDTSVKLLVNNNGQLEISADAVAENKDYAVAVQQLSTPLVANRLYKFTFDLISISPQGYEAISDRIRIGTTTSSEGKSGRKGISKGIPFSIGTNVRYFAPGADDSYIAIGGRDDITKLVVDNILLEDQSDMSFGDNLINNGSFASDSVWQKSGFVINNGSATSTVTQGSYTKLTQPITYVPGRVYKLTATVNGTSGMKIRFRDDLENESGGLQYNPHRSVTMTGSSQNIVKYFVANSNSRELAIERETISIIINDVPVPQDYSFTLDNITLQEEIASEQVKSTDLITNGNFANDSNWSTNQYVTIANGVATFNNTDAEPPASTNAYLQTQAEILTIGKIYKIVYDVISTDGTLLAVENEAGGPGTSKANLDTSTVGNDKVTYFRAAYNPNNTTTAKLSIKRVSHPSVVTLDNIRVFEVNGNPAVASSNSTNGLSDMSFSSDTP
jgi:hypothetical protein